MASTSPWSSLPRAWRHVGLPGIRELSEPGTYDGFAIEALPPIPIHLDDDFEWLLRYGTAHSGDGLDQHQRSLRPSDVDLFALLAGVPFPKSFRRFTKSADLQARVRSITDCYLDPGERLVETVGSIQGSLIHFLSDSQFCAHWYLHVLPDGNSAVLTSFDPYCFRIENADWIENPNCRLDRIDLAGLDFVFCAPSFSDFIYRFWIENEIWLALNHKPSLRPLQPLELQYVNHYRSTKSPN